MKGKSLNSVVCMTSRVNVVWVRIGGSLYGG